MTEKPIEKACIVTGATGCMGKEIAMALAKEHKAVILACRNVKRAENLKSEIIRTTKNKKIYVRELDLESNDSIKAFAGWIERKGITIWALMNNAGVMQRNYRVDETGTEISFAVNFIGTLNLTHRLIPYIVKGGNVVFTTSMTRRLHRAKNIELNETSEHFSQLGSYGRSKAALTHYAIYMANCYKDININCADPGIVDTNMITMSRWYDSIANVVFRPFIRSPKKGVEPALKALTLNSTGNIVTRHSVKQIPYSKYDQSHGHLVENTREHLVALGVPMM